jgi:uncharacterized membrane protein YgcG
MTKALCAKMLLAAMLLIFICQSSQAVELHIPPRPLTPVTDYAGYLAPDDLKDIFAELTDYNGKHETAPVYLLTVPAEYITQMDTFAKLVSHSWGIAGHDQSILLIMTADHTPKVYVQAARENTLLSDTAAAFCGAVLFPKYMKDGAAGAVKSFLSDLSMDGTSPGYIQVQYGYDMFSKHYDPNESFAKNIATGIPTNWLYTIIAVIILLIVCYFVYKTFMTGFRAGGGLNRRTTATTPAPPASPYKEQRGVKKVKGATDHKRTTPDHTTMGTDHHKPGHGLSGAGLAAGVAGLAAGAALIDAMDGTDDSDDDGSIDDGSGDSTDYTTDDNSSDYSSDSSSDYSSSDSSGDFSSSDDY